jgi:hypothetical protein
MRLGFQRRSDRAKARTRRPIGEYSYGLLQMEYLEERVLLAGTPAQLVFSQQTSSSVAAGSPVFPSIQVSILDALGTVVNTATTRLTLSIITGPSGGTLSGNTVNAVGGVATFSNVTFSQTGNYTITANDTTGGLATLTPLTITVSAPATKLAFVNQPADITADTASFSLAVSVQDASGNVVTTDHSNLTLSISSGPSGATLGGTTSRTVLYPTGQVTFDGLTLTTPGTYTLQVKDSQTGIATVVSSAFTVSAGAPAALAFAQQLTNTPVSTPVTPPITVNILDSHLNIVTTDNSAVTLDINNGPVGASVAGTTTVNAVNGVATFNDISFARTGLYTLKATDGVLTNATSNAFAVTGSPVKLAFQNTPAQSTVGTVITPSIVVLVQDSNGFTVASDTSTVTLTLASGPGAISGTTSVQAFNGVATFSNISFDQMGNYTITASDGSLTPATSSSFVVNGLATKLAFLQQPSSVASGVAITPPVTVLVEDSAGNIVVNSSASVSISVGSYSGAGSGGAISGNTVVNAVNGVATFNNLIPSPAGLYTLAASSGTLTNAMSNSFTVSPAATQLAFATGPSNVASGSTMYPAIVVRILNDAGQIVTTNTTKVTLAVVDGPKNFTLNGSTAGTLTVAAVAGAATFSNLTFTVPGTYSLLAYDGDLATATSQSFVVTYPPKKLQWGAQPVKAVVAGQVMPAMTVLVQDIGSHLVASNHSVVTLKIKSGPTGGTIVSGATVNADGGVAAFNNVKFNIAGSYVLTVSDGSLIGLTSKAFTVVADANSAQLVVTQAPSSTLVGKTFSSSVVVKVQDQFGNVIDVKQPVTLATADPTADINTLADTPVLNGTKTVFTSHGVAVFSDLSVPQVPTGGSMTIWAYDAALGSANATKSFDVRISKVLTTMRKPATVANYAVGKAFTLTTSMRGLVGSTASWTGPAYLVDSQNHILATDAAVGANGAISITVANGTVSGLTAGTYTAHVQYAGDANHTGGASPSFSLVVGPATTVSLTPSSTRLTAGSTLTLTATVKAAYNGTTARTGTLTLMDGNTAVGTMTLDGTSNNSAVFTLASPATGSHLYTAVYSGDDNFRSDTSPKVTVTVNALTTTLLLDLEPSNGQIIEGQFGTLTATVHPTSSTPLAPTGTLTLVEGTLTLGTIVLGATSNGMGVFVLPSGSIPAPAAGTHDYTVQYSGDTIFLSSVSPTVRLTVSAPG